MSPSPYLKIIEELSAKIPDTPVFLHNLLNNSQDIISISNKLGHFVWVNSFASLVLGYTKEELCSRKWIEFVHHDDINKTILEFSNLINIPNYKTNCFTNKYFAKDGKIIPLCWNAIGESDGYVYCIARVCRKCLN